MPSDPWPARRESTFRAGSRSWELGKVTRVLGILNCTPDSFSDGGVYATAEAIARRLWEIAEEGADIVDIGGESTRPGARPIGVEEEWQRVLPALQVACAPDYPLAVSIDTIKEEVARRALEEGAVIINDVSGLRHASGIAQRAAATGAGLIVMHMRGEPRTMQKNPRYDDLIGEVAASLRESVRVARTAGVGTERILVDPGIGFGKTLDHNLELLRHLSAFEELGGGLVVGTSRKSFLGGVLDLPIEERLEASIASAVASVLAGTHMVRVHDVRATVRAVRIADALRSA